MRYNRQLILLVRAPKTESSAVHRNRSFPDVVVHLIRGVANIVRR